MPTLCKRINAHGSHKSSENSFTMDEEREKNWTFWNMSKRREVNSPFEFMECTRSNQKHTYLWKAINHHRYIPAVLGPFAASSSLARAFGRFNSIWDSRRIPVFRCKFSNLDFHKQCNVHLRSNDRNYKLVLTRYWLLMLCNSPRFNYAATSLIFWIWHFLFLLN